jgi:hypothetical protein
MHEAIDAVAERAIVTPLVEDGPVTTNIGVPGLWQVKPADGARLIELLKQAWRIEEIWDDEANQNRGLWFMSNYTHPTNLLFDVLNGAGLVAFIRTIPGWRCQVYAAAWSRRAFGRDDLFQTACKLAMLANDLLVIDSFVKLDNPRSQRATLRAGFKNRGVIKQAQCYNGAMQPMYWNEIDRSTLGLDDWLHRG